MPQEVLLRSTLTETYGADGATAACDHPGSALVTATADVHVQEPADAVEHQVLLPGLPLYSTYQRAHGRDPMSTSEMRWHVERTTTALRSEGPEAATVEEPLVTVVAEVGCFDVGLRGDLAEQHPRWWSG